MTASDASTISSRLGTESCDSTLAMTSITCAPGRATAVTFSDVLSVHMMCSMVVQLILKHKCTKYWTMHVSTPSSACELALQGSDNLYYDAMQQQMHARHCQTVYAVI